MWKEWGQETGQDDQVLMEVSVSALGVRVLSQSESDLPTGFCFICF